MVCFQTRWWPEYSYKKTLANQKVLFLFLNFFAFNYRIYISTQMHCIHIKYVRL